MNRPSIDIQTRSAAAAAQPLGGDLDGGRRTTSLAASGGDPFAVVGHRSVIALVDGIFDPGCEAGIDGSLLGSPFAKSLALTSGTVAL